MSVIFPIPHSSRVAGPFTAAAGQTVFPGNFPIQSDADVQVKRKRGTVTSTLTLDTDYSVSGVNAPAGFTVTLAGGAVAGDLITLIGLSVIERLTSVAQGGMLSGARTDIELDRNRIIDQEARRDIDAVQDQADGLRVDVDGLRVDTNHLLAFEGTVAGSVATAVAAAASAATSAAAAGASATSAAIVPDRTVLKAVNPAQKAAVLLEQGRIGVYTYDPTLPADVAAADPGEYSAVFPVAGVAGAWVKRTDRAFSPDLFGAISGSSNDATAALQAYFDALTNERITTADWSADLKVSAPLVFGSNSQQMLTKAVAGHLKLTATGGTGNTLLTIRNASGLTLGSLECFGIGSLSYASRTAYFNALEADKVGRLSLLDLYAQYFSGYAFAQPSDTSVSENNNINIIRRVRAYDCGSGVQASATYALQGNYSNAANSGSSGATTQFTTIDATALPPQWLTQQLAGGAILPIQLLTGGKVYTVLTVDYVNNRMTVYPWLHSARPSGSYTLFFGGGVLAAGGDSGMLSIDQVECIRTGVVLTDAAFYGMIVKQATCESNGIGIIFGRQGGAAKLGGSISGYFENNVIDYIDHARGVTSNNYSRIGGEHALRFSKSPNVRSARLSTDAFNTAYTTGATAVVRMGQEFPVEKGAANTDEAGNPTLNMMSGNRLHTWVKNTVTFNINLPEAGANGALGIDDYHVAIQGTGTQKQPSSVTFNLPASVTWTIVPNLTTQFITPSDANKGGVTGNPVTLTSTGTLPAPLALATTYYLIVYDDGTQQLASSLANAQTQTAITLTDAGTGTHTVTKAATINGAAAAAVFTGFTEPALLSVAWQVVANNLEIRPLAGFGFKLLIGTATYDPPSIAAGARETTTVTVTGAVLGDPVMSTSFSLALGGLEISHAEVSAADTVSITLLNPTGAAIDRPSGTLKAVVGK